MNVFKINFLLIFLLISNGIFPQSFSPQTDSTTLDSTGLAKRKAYEEQLKKFRDYERRMKKNPERFRDSIQAIRDEENRKAALQRIEDYMSKADFLSLKEVDLSNARLSEIPEFVWEAKNMEILILDGNNIQVLPDELQSLSKLKRIYWRYNDLGNEKVKIARLEGIEKLDLTGNSMKKLPKVHRIKGIEELVLEKNEFEKIPLWRVRRLKSLKELEMSQNPLKIGRRWYWLIDDVRILKLNKCGIVSIHPSLYKMDGLEELQLQVNELNYIPEGISGLENLTKLSFYKNSLDSLPDDLYRLKNLEVIDLYYNQLQVIPSAIGKLQKLEILYLSFNELYDIPAEIGDISGLRELYVHHNRISEIPTNISNLSNLRVLHFQNNYVPQFPNFILSMKSLEDLDISNTDIKSIPSGLDRLNLKAFFWRELDINLNASGNTETRDMIIKMMEKGVSVSPKVFEEELPAN